MRCRPGIETQTAFATVPDQRCTASQGLALHRIRDTISRRGLDHPLRFFLGRQPPVGRELIDEFRQLLAQAGEQLVTIHAGLPGKRFDGIAAERLLQVARSDVFVRTGSDP